jgi:VWFA-related protein
MRGRAKLRISVLSGLFLVAASAWGQEAETAKEAPIGRFDGRAEVLEVSLEVRVLADGRPVAGLGLENFAVYEDGRRRELVAVEALDARSLQRRSSANPTAGSPKAISPPASRNFLLLFDFAYSDSYSLHKALVASRELVAGLGPDDRVAVAFFSALRGLELMVEPTVDRQRLETAFEVFHAMLGRDPRRAAALLAGLPPAAADSPLASAEDIVAEAGILVRSDPYWPHVSVIRSLARDLRRVEAWGAGLRGTKSVVLFSHGFDPKYLTGPGSAAVLSHLEGAFRSLRRGGWTLQAINVGGLQAPSGRDTLFFLAHETGGFAFENFNDIGEAVERMLAKTDLTYRLYFRADDLVPDGRLHRVRVRLLDPQAGARVIQPPGYYAPASAADR